MYWSSQNLLFLCFLLCQVLARLEVGRRHMQILPHSLLRVFDTFRSHQLRLCHRRKGQGWVTGQILSTTLIILWNACECDCEDPRLRTGISFCLLKDALPPHMVHEWKDSRAWISAWLVRFWGGPRIRGKLSLDVLIKSSCSYLKQRSKGSTSGFDFLSFLFARVTFSPCL